MPSVSTKIRQGVNSYFNEQIMAGFSGGLNLRDAPTELKPNESPNCFNVTLDQRGGVVKRLGYRKWNTGLAAARVQDSHYSDLTDRLFWYAPTEGTLYTDPGTGVLTLVHTFTSGFSVSFVDFAGKTYVSHAKDGLYETTDGDTFTATVATSGSVPAGYVATVWQNKLWVVVAETSNDENHNTVRIAFSAPGDATKWASADGGGTVDIREKDDTQIIALAGGAGADLQTQPGLFVFKRDSTYRIYDSTTGAYMTVDPAIGCASKKAVVGMYGELFFLSRRGIYGTRKLAEIVPVADQISPLFNPLQIRDEYMGNWCAGAAQDRIHFSMSTSSDGNNNVALEFSPSDGWVVAGSNAMNCYQTRAGTQADILIGASPSSAGQLYEMNVTGSDDGTDITSWFETRWFQVSSGHQARMSKLRSLIRGSNLAVSVWKDFELTSSFSLTVDAANGGVLWGSDLWNGALWGGQSIENYLDMWPQLVGRAFKIRVDESSSLTFGNPKLLPGFAGSLDGPVSGGWALFLVDTQYAPLGLT